MGNLQLVIARAGRTETGYDYAMAASVEQAFRAMVDEYRSRCLWFLRADYYPCTAIERSRVLDAIATHGDLRAFQRVAELRTWLLLNPSDKSVAS